MSHFWLPFPSLLSTVFFPLFTAWSLLSLFSYITLLPTTHLFFCVWVSSVIVFHSQIFDRTKIACHGQNQERLQLGQAVIVFNGIVWNAMRLCWIAWNCWERMWVWNSSGMTRTDMGVWRMRCLVGCQKETQGLWACQTFFVVRMFCLYPTEHWYNVGPVCRPGPQCSAELEYTSLDKDWASTAWQYAVKTWHHPPSLPSFLPVSLFHTPCPPFTTLSKSFFPKLWHHLLWDVVAVLVSASRWQPRPMGRAFLCWKTTLIDEVILLKNTLCILIHTCKSYNFLPLKATDNPMWSFMGRHLK